MDFSSYLENLPPIVLNKMYESVWTCQAVLRALPALAQQYVLRLLYVKTPVSEVDIAGWATPAGSSKHRAALEKLKRLQLLQQARECAGGYLLHAQLQRQLRLAVTGRAGLAHTDTPASVVAAAPSRAQLDAYATLQWEALLLHLLGPGDPPAPPAAMADCPQLQVDALLASAGLSGPAGITQLGFHFLLADTYSQLWAILREYISQAERTSSAELSSVVSFMLQLGFQEVGVPCPAAPLAPLERHIAAHLAQMGLLYPFRVGEELFFSPTRLALALAGGPSAEAQQEVSEGYVIVESNYRLYAYTSSDLKRALLRLFCECLVILPDLFVGAVTRDSITRALAAGISADQVVDYLRHHAHPHAAQRSPAVPEVVADQIRLWQADSLRVRQTRAVLYDSFESAELFQVSLAHARALGTLVWSDSSGARQRLLARAEGHDAMKAFIKAEKQRLGL